MRQKRLWIQISIEGKARQELNKYACYVSNLFTFYLPTVFIKTTCKLVVELVSEDDAFYIFPADRGESIYTVRDTLLLDEFAGNDLDKLILLAKRTISSLRKLYEHLGLQPADIISGYNNIIENNFTLKTELLKKRNRQGVKATLIVEYFLDFALIYIVFFDKEDNIIRKVDLFKTLPNHLFYSQLIHSAKWIGQSTFEVLNKSKETRININLDGETRVDYYPTGRDIEGIKQEIRYFSLEQMINIDAGKNYNLKLLH